MPRRKRLDPSILQAALDGLELQRQRLDQQISQVGAMLGPRKRGTAAKAPGWPRRTLSLAARRRIAAAQRKRWAEWKKKSKQAK